METQYPESQAAPQPGLPPNPNTTATDYSAQESQLAEMLAADDQDAAAKLFLEMIAACADNLDFPAAEKLHTRMYDETPMALNTIIKAGELIEARKEESIDQEHLDRWEALYGTLTQEETTTFCYALREFNFPAEQTVFNQGDVDGNLYLVEEGRLQLVCKDLESKEEVVIQEIQAGEIFGADHFFSFTVCTYRAVVITDCRIKCLDKHYRFKWVQDLPALENKIRKYCDTVESPSDLIVQQKIERRADAGRSSEVKAILQAIDSNNLPGDWSRSVRFTEVTPGGACLDLKLNRREDAEMLLGETVKISFKLKISGIEKAARVTARVAAINFMAFGGCEMHIEFTKTLSDKVLALF